MKALGCQGSVPGRSVSWTGFEDTSRKGLHAAQPGKLLGLLVSATERRTRGTEGVQVSFVGIQRMHGDFCICPFDVLTAF